MNKNPVQLAQVIDATEDKELHAQLNKMLNAINEIDRTKIRCMIATVVYDEPTEIDPDNLAITFISVGTPEQISRMFLEHYNNTAGIMNDLIANKEAAPEEKH
jgi:hypothetical protein